MHRLTGFERNIVHAERGAASWQDYLSTVSRVHYSLWSHAFVGRSIAPAFPGITAIVLMLFAFAGRKRAATLASACAPPRRSDA